MQSTSEGDKVVDDISELVGPARNNGLSTYQVPLELMDTHTNTLTHSLSGTKTSSIYCVTFSDLWQVVLATQKWLKLIKNASDERLAMWHATDPNSRQVQARQAKECNNRRLFFRFFHRIPKVSLVSVFVRCK